MAIGLGAALLGSAVIGAGASIIGGKSQNKAAGKAADVSMATSRENNALARENRNILTGYINPYHNMGLEGGQAYSNEIMAGPAGSTIDSRFLQLMDPGSFDDYQESTGYKFRLGEGVDALQTGYAAGGMLRSGAAMKDVTRYGQDLATAEYGNWRNALAQYGTYSDQFANQERGYQTDQYQTWLSRLQGQQNMGLGAVNALAGVNTNATGSIMANNNSAAAAQANAALAKGNANQQMWGGVANSIGGALGYFAMPSYGYGGQFGMYPSGGAVGM